MKLTGQIAAHLRQLHFGGSWTSTSLTEKLSDVTWKQATTQVDSLHTIAALVYHMNYFVDATIKVLQGEPLEAREKLSFDHPPIQSQQDWEQLLDKTYSDAETLAGLIEQMPESQLWDPFIREEYGNYYRCLHGPIEHAYYHLGQIALIKSLL
ncbi:hypothetical protein Pan153_19220 [Gimesia panareensis]|uniref:DinB-like domain-containing protein n=1 Tax=Gimesia panareensis TaxID=2527978 RepID=A0A518FLX1_9PLAN|nr:DinB family protein [Gimesia panareensis]QDV17287.1 hypothetical protein Pan153_19220 [Gimesia panareensis]